VTNCRCHIGNDEASLPIASDTLNSVESEASVNAAQYLGDTA